MSSGGGRVSWYSWCWVGKYTEEMDKYWGVCYNTEEAVHVPPKDARPLNEQYATDAWEYLAYYVLDPRPDYCIAKKAIADGKEIGHADKPIPWPFSASYTRTDVHDIMHGIKYLIGNENFKPDQGNDYGMLWASLDSSDNLPFMNNWHIGFYQHLTSCGPGNSPCGPDTPQCGPDTAPKWLPINDRGYAAGKCSMTITVAAVSHGNIIIPLKVVLRDANGMVIGWHDEADVFHHKYDVYSPLPWTVAITYDLSPDDKDHSAKGGEPKAMWSYAGQNGECTPVWPNVGEWGTCDADFDCPNPEATIAKPISTPAKPAEDTCEPAFKGDCANPEQCGCPAKSHMQSCVNG